MKTSAVKSVFTFSCNGRDYVVNKDDVAYFYPSVVNEEQNFLMLCSGKQYRAENLTEVMQKAGAGTVINVRRRL